MAAGIDDGAVAYEDRFPIVAGATGLALSLECVRRGVPLVKRLVHAAGRGLPIPARKQDLTCRRYFPRRPPEGGSISFSKGAADVDAHLRAADYRPFASPWGHPRVGSECGEVRLLSADACVGTGRTSARPGTVRLTSGGRALVACSDGWIALATVLLDGELREANAVLRDGEVLRPLAP
jgi:methionyl-tRNA formyltransferase